MKLILIMYFISPTESIRSGTCVILTAHVNLDQVYFMCSITTRGWWPLWQASNSSGGYWQQSYRDTDFHSSPPLSEVLKNAKSSYEKHLSDSLCSLWKTFFFIPWLTQRKALGSVCAWKCDVDFLFLSVTRSCRRRILSNFGIMETTY